MRIFTVYMETSMLIICTYMHTHSYTDIVWTWSGQLPPRRHKNPTYSPRVFLGGVPWDITEAALLHTFQVFGNLTVDWPGKDNKHNRHPPKGMCVCGRETQQQATVKKPEMECRCCDFMVVYHSNVAMYPGFLEIVSCLRLGASWKYKGYKYGFPGSTKLNYPLERAN